MSFNKIVFFHLHGLSNMCFQQNSQKKRGGDFDSQIYNFLNLIVCGFNSKTKMRYRCITKLNSSG